MVTLARLGDARIPEMVKFRPALDTVPRSVSSQTEIETARIMTHTAIPSRIPARWKNLRESRWSGDFVATSGTTAALVRSTCELRSPGERSSADSYDELPFGETNISRSVAKVFAVSCGDSSSGIESPVINPGAKLRGRVLLDSDGFCDMSRCNSDASVWSTANESHQQNTQSRFCSYHSPHRKNHRLFPTKLQTIYWTNEHLLIQILPVNITYEKLITVRTKYR